MNEIDELNDPIEKNANMRRISRVLQLVLAFVFLASTISGYPSPYWWGTVPQAFLAGAILVQLAYTSRRLKPWLDKRQKRAEM